jgi:hypothetical protein
MGVALKIWKQTVGCAMLALATMSPVRAQVNEHVPAHAWEAALAAGRDFDSNENLWAVSLGRLFGNGWKGVFEFADGKHGSHGSYVTSLKAMKEVARWGHAEFGLGAGGAYVSEEHHNGWGVVVAAELAYPIAERWAAKLEASYLFGVGELSSLRAPVVQAGVVFKF